MCTETHAGLHVKRLSLLTNSN